MIEWEGYIDPQLAVPVHSLYGAKRKPDAGMLEAIDTMVIDLPDVGARPYTYVWTALLTVRACAESNIPVVLLDRPNPIGGRFIEGPGLDERFRSFIGLHPIPMRHGCTMGELLSMMNAEDEIGCNLEIVRMDGWERTMYFEATGLPWVLPSPNMPTPETAVVYPGMVLLEGTNISEGRGTTRPFEIIGAPWIDPGGFARELSGMNLGGVSFRPLSFTPTWDKYSGSRCGGVQLHVTDRARFMPVATGVAVITAAARLYPGSFGWSDPPYEYEYEKPPIDILFGSEELRLAIDAGAGEPAGSRENAGTVFETRRRPYLLYR